MTRVVRQVTSFPQTWIGTLLYSYAMNGNGHVISGDRVTYEHNMAKETLSMAHYAYMVGVLVFDTGHHTMAQCCSNLIRKDDASVSTHKF
jgi:hypothetical protein